MSESEPLPQGDGSEAEPKPAHRRRPRYSGTHPRRFQDKYKEHAPERYLDTVAKVLASGKTPAGMHRPIMVREVLTALDLHPGEVVVDATLGWGGHAREMLPQVLPGGRLIGIDADPVELPRTEARLRALGFGAGVFAAHRSNYAGLPKVLAAEGVEAADAILADLGLSSMQIDDPARGFSVKTAGPLDMRMNPLRGVSARHWLTKTPSDRVEQALIENADEPRARLIASVIAGHDFPTTTELAAAIRAVVARQSAEEQDLTVRRVFQAIRIEVNDEFSALDTFLRVLPACLKPAGRVAILTFHSGEDRRVKKAFEKGSEEGVYSEISTEVIRPGASECGANPRATPAKLRWARRSA